MGDADRAGRFGLVTLVVCLTGVASAQEVRHPGAEKIPALFEQARPHLEAALGGKLERPPQFRVVTAAQLAQFPDPDLPVFLRWHFPDLRGDALRRALQVAHYTAATATVAHFAEGSDTIHVAPDNLTTMAGWDASLAQVNTPAFLQLALVREAARMALVQRYRLTERRATCRDAEEFKALRAVIEGRCQWVTRAVARKLGTEIQFGLLAERFLRVPDLAPDPALRAVSQLPLRQRFWACTKGLAFFDHLDRQRLPDTEKRAFTRPPRLSRWVELPELYTRSEQRSRPDLAAALRALEQSLPPAEWAAGQQPLTPRVLKQVGALLGEGARVDRAIATWDEGRMLVWAHKKSPGRQVGLSVVRHESAAGARGYFGLAVDLQRKQDTLDPKTCGTSLRVLESKATTVKLAGTDEAVRLDKRVQYGTGGAPVVVSTVLAWAGDVAVECSWIGQPADMAWAERVLPAILAVAGK
ncbi:MAG: hypothetical protein IT429_06580 [Gemmataceae bacterium]|nr:hypothetical protein [Gemmataceae bacterium]